MGTPYLAVSDKILLVYALSAAVHQNFLWNAICGAYTGQGRGAGSIKLYRVGHVTEAVHVKAETPIL